MSYLVLKNIQKQFEDFTAIKNVSLSVEKGEFIALLGPSDCGKSTLLRVMSGLESPTYGAITIDGVDVTQLA